MTTVQESLPITARTAGTVILAAPGTNKRLHLKKLILTGKASTTAVVTVTDGTTIFAKYTPDYGHPGTLDFGDFGDNGYPCEKNTALSLILETADIQVLCIAIAEVLGG